jgi:hypothetical protein
MRGYLKVSKHSTSRSRSRSCSNSFVIECEQATRLGLRLQRGDARLNMNQQECRI